MTERDPSAHNVENQTSASRGESDKSSRGAYLIAASVLAASLIVAGSVLYSAKMLAGSDGKIGKQPLAGVQAENNQPAPNAPGVAGAVVANLSDRAGAAQLGKNDAPITLVEFSDFQCPFCQKFYNESYQKIKAKYVDTGKAKLVFRHFPLSFHQNARKAAEASECALRQGKFFEYHDLLFAKGQADGSGLAEADLKRYAFDLRLDTRQFNQCLDEGQTAEIVSQDLVEGQAAGVQGTPTVFINGKPLVGAQPYPSFEQAIETALQGK